MPARRRFRKSVKTDERPDDQMAMDEPSPLRDAARRRVRRVRTVLADWILPTTPEFDATWRQRGRMVDGAQEWLAASPAAEVLDRPPPQAPQPPPSSSQPAHGAAPATERTA